MKTPKALKAYQKKRNLARSPEPRPKLGKRKKGELCFVVQKHRARALHYDLRLEVDGVLKSWAVPKGPSMNPSIKRLAIQVEDHPYDYKDFEGIIPEGYGAGTVIIWDQGPYEAESEKAMRDGLEKGVLHFTLHGEKLKGQFMLVRFRGENQWLLTKKKDEFATSKEITKQDRSVVSGLTIEKLSRKK